MSLNLSTLFEKNGFIEFENIFENNSIDKWNKILDNSYQNHNNQKISVHLSDLGKDGYIILNDFFNNKIKFIINELIKDPIIYYAGSNEIPSDQTKSHVNHNEIDGWHTDTGENLQYLDYRKPYWITFFVYLTDVSGDNGAFEITNLTKKKLVNHNVKSHKLIGPKGKCFLWGNNFYHRASPNNSDIRRRILKIQIQHNYLQNTYLEKLKEFEKYISDNDNYLKFLIGSKHFSTYRDWPLETRIDHQNIEVINFENNKRYNSKIKFNFLRRIKKNLKNLLNVY
jgi:ectoine hydroxylase-related dioxygenase (phytanoyl-CoA dioxygenase family)